MLRLFPKMCLATQIIMTCRGLSTASKVESPAAPLYRLVYFNLRGAAEPTRYLLAVANAPYDDFRYPMHASGKGFGVDDNFLRDKQAGHFGINMGQLPILQILTPEGKIAATLGQSHSINRFIAEQHGLLGKDPIERAWIDGIYESVRDIRSIWFRKKKEVVAERKDWLAKGLPEKCNALEASLPPNSGGIWLVGEGPSLADIALYSMLGSQTSLVTGATESFFDGFDANAIEKAYSECPRLSACVKEIGALQSIQQWEERRPDTFN
jgi:glutathione S-transferase